MPVPHDGAAHDLSRIAGKNCFLFGEDAMHKAACTHGGEGRQGGAFGDYDVASQPDVVGKGDGTVGVEVGAGVVDEAMLVGVHDSAAPRGEHVAAERNGEMADDERAGAEVEMVAQGEGGTFGHFDAASGPNGAFTKEADIAAEVEEGAVVVEIGELAGVETDFDQADAEGVGMEGDEAGEVENTCAVGDKQGQTARLTEGQQSEVEIEAAGQGQEVAEGGEAFVAVAFVHGYRVG